MMLSRYLAARSAVFGTCMGLVACGGSGSGSSEQQIGVFIDSPVAGLEYSSESLTGLTNSLGEFSYIPGETITFRVGGVELGSAIAREQVFVKDLFPGEREFSAASVNIARFLIMLDSDDLPENGIHIAESTRALAQGWSAIDFSAEVIDEALAIVGAAIGKDSSGFDFSQYRATRHLLASLNCNAGGLYKDATGGTDGSELFFAVTPEGMVRAYDQGLGQWVTTAMRYPGGGAGFDSTEDLFTAREVISVSLSGTPIDVGEPDLGFSDVSPINLLPPVGLPAFSIDAFPANRFGPVAGEPPEANDWQIVGDLSSAQLVGQREDPSGAASSFSAARLLPLPGTSKRLLANYSKIGDPDVLSFSDFRSSRAGMVDAVIDADLNVTGFAFDWTGEKVVEITGTVVNEDGEQQLIITDEEGFFSASYDYDPQRGTLRQIEFAEGSPNTGLLAQLYISDMPYDVPDTEIIAPVYLAVDDLLEGTTSSAGGLVCP